MDKVWLYTEGSYSSYCVDAVFSTKEKADAYAAERGEDGAIEEWDIDQFAGYVRRPWWMCRIDRETGDVIERGKGTEVISPHERGHVESHKSGRAYPRKGWYDAITATSFVSEQHALKLAAEARQAHLRNQTEP